MASIRAEDFFWGEGEIHIRSTNVHNIGARGHWFWEAKHYYK